MNNEEKVLGRVIESRKNSFIVDYNGKEAYAKLKGKFYEETASMIQNRDVRLRPQLQAVSLMKSAFISTKVLIRRPAPIIMPR